MVKNYDSTDLMWTSRGDYVISHNGDLMDSFADPLRSIVQEILSRVKSDKGEWRLYRQLGSSLSDFVGELNDRHTAEAIKTRIISSVAQFNLVDPKDLNIIYAPVDNDRLLIRLSLSVAPTSRNNGTQTLVINFMYSYSDNNVYFIGR